MKNEKWFKSRFKRVVKNRGRRTWVCNKGKGKLKIDRRTVVTGLYACECGCSTFGNQDLYLVNNVPMTMEHGLMTLDLEYRREKLMTGLLIPKKFLNPDKVGSAVSLGLLQRDHSLRRVK